MLGTANVTAKNFSRLKVIKVMNNTLFSIQIYEVVKIIELEPLRGADDVHESYKFRIEILRHIGSDAYYANVYRKETYRICPTFPLGEDGEPNSTAWDAEILVHDLSHAWETIMGNSEEEVVDKVIEEIKCIFLKSSNK